MLLLYSLLILLYFNNAFLELYFFTVRSALLHTGNPARYNMGPGKNTTAPSIKALKVSQEGCHRLKQSCNKMSGRCSLSTHTLPPAKAKREEKGEREKQYKKIY